MAVAVVAFSIRICGTTETTSVELHSAAGSAAPGGQLLPGEVTDAVLATVPAASTSSGGNGSAAAVTTSMVTVVLAATSPSAQVIVVPPGGVQTAGSADTNVSPAGSASLTVTSVAV